MRFTILMKNLLLAAILALIGEAAFSLLLLHHSATAVVYAAPAEFAAGPQYDTTHVYVKPEDFNVFVASLLTTLGGATSKQGVFTVTPTPSSTMSQLVLTPAGTLSVFGFKTPIPYPFGIERTGYLVTDLDKATKAAPAAGSAVIVAPFPDPIGRDAIIQWSGGVGMQLYWHTTAPHYPALANVPENRVYVSPDRAALFVADFIRFAHGRIVSDDARAPGIEIGRAGETYRRIRIESGFGKMVVMVSDGHLPWPYGREVTGYEVADLDATLAKAKAAGVSVLVAPFDADGRVSALVQFPGGYIAEVHATSPAADR